MRAVLAFLAAGLLAACGAAPTPLPTPTVGPPTAVPTPRVTPEPTLPPDTSSPEDTPSPEEAYQQLAVSIPLDLSAKCKPAPRSEKLAANELAQADCALPAGSLADSVTYRLFDGPDGMDAYFDAQRHRHETNGTATGPGCGRGPGEGTWDGGRKDCFTLGTGAAQVMWTHDLLYVEADAFRIDGDWARLEQFWQVAGPVTP